MKTQTTRRIAIAARLTLSLTLLSALAACAKKGDAAAGATTNYTFRGGVASVHTSGFALVDDGNLGRIHTRVAKTVTHVMAIGPESSDPVRYIAEVAADGTFNLGVKAGRPYVMVFVANGQGFSGPDMIVGVANVSGTQLDTLAPVSAGEASVGTDITLDGTAQTATINTSTAALYASLGITSAEATFLGSIDDLSLRSANPDVDGNGVIDLLEEKNFHQDWHLRTDNFGTFNDIVGTFLVNPTLAFNLNSAYAVYPSSFYAGSCAANSGVNTTLVSGCSFDIKNEAGTASVAGSWPFSSFSGGGFGDSFQTGPDFVPTSGQNLPGSAGTPVRMVYGFPNGQTLTFWNVKTRTNASLTANGTVVPFLKLNTTGGTTTGTMLSIDYKWMKLVSGTWTAATASEVALLVNENGAYAKFYTAKSSGVEEGFAFKIPRTAASGTLQWNSTDITANGASAVFGTATPQVFCSSAVSYDDKLGLRIFAGGFNVHSGGVACN